MFGGESVVIFSRVEFDCPMIEEISSRFRAVGDFYSVFFGTSGISSIGDGPAAFLAEVLQSDELAKAVPKLLPLNLSAGKDCAAMNRYEFEGSLVGVLLQGTCTDRVVCDEREASEVARAMMKEAVLRPNGHIQVFRMNDPSWSALTNQATLWWAYFVFESSRHVCWFVCFADPY
jgi:hypothetical protein